MIGEFNKRLMTSIILITLSITAFLNSFVLIILLILLCVFSWVEFNGLINGIILKNQYSNKILKLVFSATFLIYIIYFSAIIFSSVQQVKPEIDLNIVYLLFICICSDIGGYIFGKSFKGKKLTKISPNKTIIGSIGSFILPLLLVPIFFYLSLEKFNIFNLIILAIMVSLVCQIGDLFISYLKRKANVKDTGDLLPGHGGVLDRIDGILFALPFGLILWKFLIN